MLARIAAFAMGLEAVQRFAFRTVSQIGIHYRPSALSQSTAGLPEGAPRAGDRFPWLQLKLTENGPVEDLFRKFDDLRFHLFVVGQPVPTADDRGKTSAGSRNPRRSRQRRRTGARGDSRTSFYLVRPDGYIGLAGTKLEAGAVERYFSARLKLT